MTVAVISDIHSNLHALKVVLEELDRFSPEALVCAGDVVGYGAHPNECCRMVSDAADAVVEGNHDSAALTGETSGMNPYAAAAALWTREALDADAAKLLQGLSRSASLETSHGKVSVFHGSDTDRDEYVYEERVDPDILSRCASRFVVLGHTHVPFVRSFEDGLVVNPGAVGQPRDGDPRASFAVLDPSSRTCDVVRVEYDVEGASEAILKAGLPMMLALRLSVGK